MSYADHDVASRCAFDNTTIGPDDNGICPSCWKAIQKPLTVIKASRSEVGEVLAQAPEPLRQDLEEQGDLLKPEPAFNAILVGLLHVALAVEFGDSAIDTVANRVDEGKLVIASVYNLAIALGYKNVAERLLRFRLGEAKDLIRFRDTGKGVYQVHTPYNEEWNVLARRNRQIFFTAPEKDAGFWWRTFHTSELRRVANLLQGVYGDQLTLGLNGKLFALPSMPLPKEDDFGKAPTGKPKETGERPDIPDEIEGIRLGDKIRLPGGGESIVQFINPRKKSVGVGDTKEGRYTFYSFDVVETENGRPVAARLLAERKAAAREVGGGPVEDVLIDRVIPAEMKNYQIESIAFIEQNRRVILADEQGLGKGFTYGTTVLTPSGWVAIETLTIGDAVIDPDGGVATVTGVFPQPRQPVFEVTFSDGVKVKTDATHQWHVYTHNDKTRKTGGRVISTGAMLESGTRAPCGGGWTGRKWSVPIMMPAAFDRRDGDRTWPPYVLGVLLGDGSFGGSVQWSKPDEEIAERMSRLVSVNRLPARDDRCPVFSVAGGPEVARRLHLHGVPSEEKFIPTHYMTGSLEERVELLRGLMDTDGDCTKEGTAVFNTSSPRLRDDVVELVRSLGGIATVYTKPEPKFTYKSETRIGLPAYRVNVLVPFNPFHLTRKGERWKMPLLARSIESVEYVGEAETICISVNSKRNLYVAEGHVVTHNSAVASTCIDTPAIIVCPATLKHNWVDQISKWRPDLTSLVITISGGEHPSVAERKRATVFIINYDIVEKHLDWLTKIGAKTLIADEAHYLKNLGVRWDSKIREYRPTDNSPRRAKAFYELHNNIPKLILATGTPLMNRTKELFPLLHLCNKQEWNNQTEFQKRYCGAFEKDTPYGKVWDANGRTNSDELHKRITKRYLIRHTKAMVLTELPPKMRTSILVPLSEKWRRAYVQLTRDFLAWVYAHGGPDKVAKASRAEALTRLTAMRRLSANGKVEAALEWIQNHLESTGFRPLIVMGVHADAFKALGKGLDAINAKFDADEAAGEMPSISRKIRWDSCIGADGLSKRVKVAERFQKTGDIDVLLFSIPLATGLTLTRSQDMLFLERIWRPADQVQAEDRIHRIGQKGSVQITYLDGMGTIDQKMGLLLMDKGETAAEVIDGEELSHAESFFRVFGEILGKDGKKMDPSKFQSPESLSDLIEEAELEAIDMAQSLDDLVKARQVMEKQKAELREAKMAKGMTADEAAAAAALELDEDIEEFARKLREKRGVKPNRMTAIEAGELYPGHADDHAYYEEMRRKHPDFDEVLDKMVVSSWNDPRPV